MEFLRAGEALLPFLAPSAHLVRIPRVVTNATTATTSRQWRAQHQSRSPFQSKQITRAFTSSHVARKADEPPPSSDRDQQSNNISDIRSLLDSTLDGTKGTPVTDSSRRSRIASRSGQRLRDPLSSTDQAPPSTSSIDDFIKSIHQQQKSAGAPASPFGRPPRLSREPAPLDPPKTKLGVSVGRTSHVTDTVDPARAFRNLDIKCRRNRVQADFQRQRFHERPGLVRKRLKRQRWRKRFKEEFRNTVQMVKRLKAQGW